MSSVFRRLSSFSVSPGLDRERGRVLVSRRVLRDALACCASWRVRGWRIASLPSVIDDLVVEAFEVPELFVPVLAPAKRGVRLAVAAACIREKRDLACQQQSAEGKTQPERQKGIGGARTGISSETARPRRRRAARA